MDTIPAGDIGYIPESERKREGRLTTIIDQLLSNRATSTFGDVVKSEKRIKGKHRNISSSVGRIDGGMSSMNAPLDRQVVQTSANDSHPKKESGLPNTSFAKTSVSNKARRKKIVRNNSLSANLKHERCSPDMETGTASSRSVSPASSPISHSFRPASPSTEEIPNNSYVSPADRFSPGNYNVSNNKSMSEGLQMSRNYSDFMRSLAAKYNNSNDYRSQQTNSLISILDSRASCKDLIPGEGSSQSPLLPLFDLPLDTFTSHALAASKHYEMALAMEETEKKERKEFTANPLLPLYGLTQDNSIRQAMPSGFHSGTIMDMSSTQALLSIVRSATTRGSPRIDTYSSDPITRTDTPSLKRPSESIAVASQTPLDLSASMAKRPYLESRSESLGRSRFCHHASPRSSAIESNNIPGRQLSAIGGKSSASRFAADNVNAHGEKKIAIQNKIPFAQFPTNCRLSCAAHSCSTAAAEVQKWSISHVVDFVKSIEICTEYAQAFADQSIDGSTLPLLTEEHLITSMNMKLGPALKLRSTLARKIGHCAICLHCVHCHAEPTGVEQQPPAQDHKDLFSNT